jgi:hypothetical protein
MLGGLFDIQQLERHTLPGNRSRFVALGFALPKLNRTGEAGPHLLLATGLVEAAPDIKLPAGNCRREIAGAKLRHETASFTKRLRPHPS